MDTKPSALLAVVLLTTTTFSNESIAQTVDSLPLADIQGLVYEGAFQVSSSTFGESRINYAEGPIAYNPTNHSLYVVGHGHQQAIAEFPIPELVGGSDLSELNVVSSPNQLFSRVLGRPKSGNPQNMNRIGGLAVINGELIVNTYEYYDADRNTTNTTLVIRNPGNLSSSIIDGYYNLSPGAHASRWISRIPLQWRNLLGGEYIAGSSSGKPIISRHSVGPSAFAFDPARMADGTPANTTIPTNTALDFSLANPLHDDLSNDSGSNKLWTHVSFAAYGFIIPNSRSYLTIGHSGGHNGGIGYKITQDNGNQCGGYCSRIASDNYNYYWLWDINDLVRVKEGKVSPSSVRPYAFGQLPMPFQQSGFNEISGASFDSESGRLYVSLDGAGSGESSPVFAVFSLSSEKIIRPESPLDLRIE
ncbi:MAG: hypothetical protein O7G31_13460 [Calditrichaeota bacterium]|nr:hypothetical protein [Calditrichota bacterium]